MKTMLRRLSLLALMVGPSALSFAGVCPANQCAPPTGTVPEIDLGTGAIALVVLAGASVVVRAKLRNRR
ncbi:MAG TPA: hypothetical protein VMB03_07055 [Bryobacteraceae bacterium]|nr:hypothetical protein [Bryobacteraceae bacterium]